MEYGSYTRLTDDDEEFPGRNPPTVWLYCHGSHKYLIFDNGQNIAVVEEK